MTDDDNITIGPVRDAETGEIETPASETGSGDGQGLGEENFDGDDVSSFDPENDTDEDPDPEPEPEDTGGDSDGTPTAIVAGDPGSSEGVQTVGEGQTEAEAQLDAAQNPEFDADPGTEIDAAETVLETSQADGTTLQELNERQQSQQTDTQRTDRDPIDERFTEFAFEAAQRQQAEQAVQNLPEGLTEQPTLAPGDPRFKTDVLSAQEAQFTVPEQDLPQSGLRTGQNLQGTNIKGEPATPETGENIQTQIPAADFNLERINRQTEENIEEQLPGDGQTTENIADTAGFAATTGAAVTQEVLNIPRGLQELLTDPIDTTTSTITETGETLADPEPTDTGRIQQGLIATSLATGAAGRLGSVTPGNIPEVRKLDTADETLGTQNRIEDFRREAEETDTEALPSLTQDLDQENQRPERATGGQPDRPEEGLTPEEIEVLTGQDPGQRGIRQETQEGGIQEAFTTERRVFSSGDVEPERDFLELEDIERSRANRKTRQAARRAQEAVEGGDAIGSGPGGLVPEQKLVSRDSFDDPAETSNVRSPRETIDQGIENPLEDAVDDFNEQSSRRADTDARREVRNRPETRSVSGLEGLSLGLGLSQGQSQGSIFSQERQEDTDQGLDQALDNQQQNQQETGQTGTGTGTGEGEDPDPFTDTPFLPDPGAGSPATSLTQPADTETTRNIEPEETEDEELFPFLEDEENDVQDQAVFAPSLSAAVFNVQADEDFDDSQVFSGLETRPLLQDD